MGLSQCAIGANEVIHGCFYLDIHQYPLDFLGGMAPRNALRSNTTERVKDVGVIEHFPQRPLTKRNILQRYNAFMGSEKYTVQGTEKENMPIHNMKLREKYIVQKIYEEVVTLYKKFGLKPMSHVAMKDKIGKVRTEYRKSQKNSQAKARLNLDEVISFKAKQQPREVLKEDLEWYNQVIQGSPGHLGSVDRTSIKREIKRLKCRSRNENADLRIVSSDLAIQGSDTEDEEEGQLQEIDAPYEIDSRESVAIANMDSNETDIEMPKRKRCRRHLDWSPVIKVQCRMGYSSEGVQLLYDAFRQVMNLPPDVIPSDTTLHRRKKTLTANLRDAKLANIKEGDLFLLQFDGKDTKEAVMISALKHDQTVETMPLAVIEFKAHPTGKSYCLYLY